MSPSGSLSATNRVALGTVIAALALLVLAAGWTIPFKFASYSILYKFGLEKTYLRSGKVLGITLTVLVLYQVILASRFAILERVFSFKRLWTLHRINGMAIGFLVMCHPVLIKAAENFTPYTFEKKYYPEFLGFGVLAVLLILALTAVFRNFFRLSYARWLFLHRCIATLALVLMPAHVLYVSETFKAGIPRQAALALFGLNLVLITRVWLRRLIAKA